jgi:hypothetical protein
MFGNNNKHENIINEQSSTPHSEAQNTSNDTINDHSIVEKNITPEPIPETKPKQEPSIEKNNPKPVSKKLTFDDAIKNIKKLRLSKDKKIEKKLLIDEDIKLIDVEIKNLKKELNKLLNEI